MIAELLACWLIQLGPAPTEPEPTVEEPAPEPAEARIEALVIRAPDEIVGQILDGVSLRSPGVALLDARAEQVELAVPTWAFVDVRPMEDRYRISIVVSDGRGYDREVPIEGNQGPRAAATAIANLIAAISEGLVRADREDAKVPDQVTEKLNSEPEPEPEPKPEPEPEPEPEPPGAAAPPEPRTRVELGPVLLPSVAVGIGPPSGASVAGAFGYGTGVGLHLRTKQLALASELRWLMQARDGIRLDRFRIGLGAGYRVVNGRFELAATGLVTLAPWMVSEAGTRVEPVEVASGEPGHPPLAGVAVRAAPVARLGRRTVFRIGGWAELGYAGVVGAGFGALRVLRDQEVLVRAGGLELSAGLQLALAFAVER